MPISLQKFSASPRTLTNDEKFPDPVLVRPRQAAPDHAHARAFLLLAWPHFASETAY